MGAVYIVSSVKEGKLDMLEPHAGNAYAFIRAEEISREYALIHGGKVNTNPDPKTTIHGLEWNFYSTEHGEVKVFFRRITVPDYKKY